MERCGSRWRRCRRSSPKLGRPNREDLALLHGGSLAAAGSAVGCGRRAPKGRQDATTSPARGGSRRCAQPRSEAADDSRMTTDPPLNASCAGVLPASDSPWYPDGEPHARTERAAPCRVVHLGEFDRRYVAPDSGALR